MVVLLLGLANCGAFAEWLLWKGHVDVNLCRCFCCCMEYMYIYIYYNMCINIYIRFTDTLYIYIHAIIWDDTLITAVDPKSNSSFGAPKWHVMKLWWSPYFDLVSIQSILLGHVWNVIFRMNKHIGKYMMYSRIYIYICKSTDGYKGVNSLVVINR